MHVLHNKGLNWHSWGAMSMSKAKGGLGFRSLYGFNLALLGKLAWNFMSNPTSLVARVFKARYFPTTHFLQAPKCNGSSYIWTGILCARDALVEGYRWVLGSGTDIKIATDPWLRGKCDFKVDQHANYDLRNEVVAYIFCSWC